MASEPTASTRRGRFHLDAKKFCNLKTTDSPLVFSEQFPRSFRTALTTPDILCLSPRLSLQNHANSFSTGSVVRVRGRFIAVVFILLMIIKGGAAQDRIDDFRNAGVREYHAGNFAAAEALFLQAKEAAVSASNRELEAIIDNDLGNVEMGADRGMKAGEFYHSALAIFRAMPDKYFEFAATLLNLAYVDEFQRHSDDAQLSLTQARKILLAHPALPDSQLLMAEISNILGIVLLDEGKLDKARAQFEQAMSTRAAVGAPEELDARTLHNIGVIYQIKHKYTEAESALLKSLEIRAHRLGSSHPDLTLTLIPLGQTYTAMGRYEEAARQFERGLTILRGLDTPFPERMVQILGLAGSNYFKQGDLRLAARSFQEALDLYRSTPVNAPTLLVIFDDYADFLQKQGKVDDAKNVRAEAKRIRLKNALTMSIKK